MSRLETKETTHMWPAFEKMQARYAELETLLGEPDVIADRARYPSLAKEHGSLARKVKPYREYLKLASDLAQAEEMLQGADADMKQMIDDEVAVLRPQKAALHARLEDMLLAEGEDYSSIIL